MMITAIIKVRSLKNSLLNVFGALVCMILLQSCASVTTRRVYNVKVSSGSNNAKLNFAGKTYDLPAKVKMERSKHDTLMTLIVDSISRDYVIKSSPSTAFVYGNLLWFYLAPVGYAIDFTNQKRFYYGKSIRLNLSDTSEVIYPPVSRPFRKRNHKAYLTKQGRFNTVISLPHINSFYMQPIGEPEKANTGFWGIAAGVEYYYRDKKYFAINGRAVMDFFVPVPAAVDIDGEYELLSSAYLSLTDNFRFNRVSLGYGVNLSRNTWSLSGDYVSDSSMVKTPSVRKGTSSFGLTLDTYYQCGKYFFVGVIYRPNFLRVGPHTKLLYEHLISLDFALKIGREKRKKSK